MEAVSLDTLKTRLDWAKYYVNVKKFSVIPLLPKRKTPDADMLPIEIDAEGNTVFNEETGKPERTWDPYKDRRPTEEELHRWFGNGSQRNIGIVVGPLSNISVIDFDSEEGIREAKEKKFPRTPLVQTGREPLGYHAYCKFSPSAQNFRTKPVEMKATGGYVVAPPSIHPDTGKTYQWKEGFSLEDLAPVDIPSYLIRRENGKGKPDYKDLHAGVPNGQRTNSLTKLIGSWLKHGLDFDEVLFNARQWNEKNSPPLSDRVVVSTVTNLFKRHERNNPEEKRLAFPQIMAGVAGDFAETYSKHLETPPEFLFISFLTCLGSVLSDCLTLDSEIRPEPRLYCLLLGESADERKSTAIKKTTELFYETITDFPVCHGVGSAEGLQKRLTDNNKLLLCFDEFKQFVSKCRIDASVLLPCVNTLFESNHYESVTKSSHIKLENVFLSMLAASTIQTYESTWDPSFTDIGFNNRLFLVPGTGEKKFAIPQKIPQNARDELKGKIAQILTLAQKVRTMRVTEGARNLFEGWYATQERSIHAKRLDTYALRFMSLLAVNEFKSEVDEEIIEKTCNLMDWELTVRRLYDPIDADNIVARMEEKIRRLLSVSQQSGRELKKKCHVERHGIWAFNTAINNLQREAEIFFDRGGKRWKSR